MIRRKNVVGEIYDLINEYLICYIRTATGYVYRSLDRYSTTLVIELTGTSSEFYPTVQDVTKIFRTPKLERFATNPSCLDTYIYGLAQQR
jgi:hypothetical protein